MAREGPVRLSGDGIAAPIQIFDDTGAAVLGITRAGAVTLGKTGGTLGLLGAAAAAQGAAYTQTFATPGRTVSAATAVNPPAGGAGAAAGAYDTAANRDLMITSLTAVIADVAVLRGLVNALIDDLQAAGISA